MTWLTEDPTPILVLGGIVLLILAIAVWKTGRGALLGVMGVVALLMLGAVLIDHFVVTERERVTETIHQAAAALEANDVERLKPLLTPEAAEVLREVRWVFDTVQIEKVNIAGTPEVKVYELTVPPSAVAVFIGSIQGKLKHGESLHDKAVRRIELRLRLDDGKWRIEDAKHTPLIGEG